MEIDEKNQKKHKKSTKKIKKIEKNENSSSLIDALKLKAVGYETKEIIEEYALDENSMERLIKKKVTIKNIPPDVTSIKVLLELEKLNEQVNVTSLTNEQIDDKINEIICKLKENENDN